MGIIDTLTAGFDLVRKKLWLALLPAALDIGLWLAPKLSISVLMQRLMQAALAPMASGAQMPGNLQETVGAFRQMAEGIDLTAMLSSSSLGVPSLPPTGTAGLFGLTRQVIEVQGGLALFGLMAGLSLAGFLFAALYLGLIAQQVRDGQGNLGQLLRRLPRYWLRLVGSSLLIMALLMALGFPLAFTLGLMGLLSQGLAAGLMWMASLALVWVLLFLAFVPQAILMGEDGVLRALAHSIGVVRANFWPTLGLLALVNLIMLGLAFVWDLFTGSSLGAVVAIVANAFIGTGLTSAVFIFYRDRLQALRTPAQQRSQA